MKKLIILLPLVIMAIKISGMEPEPNYPYRDIAKFGDTTSYLGSLPPELRKELAQYVTEAERKMRKEFKKALFNFNIKEIDNLLQEGANPNEKGIIDDYTPLTYILHFVPDYLQTFIPDYLQTFISIFHLLVNAGADVRKIDGNNRTPLLLAVLNDYPEIANTIVEEFKYYPQDTLNINIKYRIPLGSAIAKTIGLGINSLEPGNVTVLDIILRKYGPTSSLARRLLKLGAKTYKQIEDEREREKESEAINKKMEEAFQEFQKPLLSEEPT